MTRRSTPIVTCFSLLLAVALLIDAVIHLHLAHRYQLAAPGGIGEGNLFRIEAVVALIVAVAVVLRPSVVTFAAGFVVSAAGVAAVLLYRYVDVSAFGPIPAMYEPIWFREKAISAVAEAAGAVIALVAGVLAHRVTRDS